MCNWYLISSLLIQWGRAKREVGSLTSITTYTGILATSFNSLFSGTGITSTSNGVVGIHFTDYISNSSEFVWDMKPNHESTSNTVLFYIMIGT